MPAIRTLLLGFDDVTWCVAYLVAEKVGYWHLQHVGNLSERSNGGIAVKSF
jgi:hypothetical protein